MLHEFLLNHIASIAGILLGICYVPQIYKIIKSKNVDGMSVPFWIILNFALSCLVVNAVVVFQVTGAYGYMITEFFNEGLALVTLLLVLKYRKKE